MTFSMKMRKTTAHRERSFLIMSVIMLVAALIGLIFAAWRYSINVQLGDQCDSDDATCSNYRYQKKNRFLYWEDVTFLVVHCFIMAVSTLSIIAYSTRAARCYVTLRILAIVSILVAAVGVGVAAYALYYIVDIINRNHDMWPELICYAIMEFICTIIPIFGMMFLALSSFYVARRGQFKISKRVNPTGMPGEIESSVDDVTSVAPSEMSTFSENRRRLEQDR